MSDGAGGGATGPRRRLAARKRLLEPSALLAVSGRITALEEQRDPQRRSLHVDGQFILGLDLETLVRCSLKVGQAVDGPALWRAYQMDLEKRAWESALRLLAAAPRTAREVGRRLGRGYPSDTVERVLERLAAAGWLDDRAYAQSHVRSHPEHGGRRLLADLIRKGVDRGVAAAVVEAERGEVEAADQAREVAARRLARMGQVDRATAERRLSGFLARRGFGPDAIQRALAPLLAPLPSPPASSRVGGSSLARRSGLGRRSGLRRVDEPTGEEELAR